MCTRRDCEQENAGGRAGGVRVSRPAGRRVRAGRRGGTRARGRERGSASLELLGVIPLLMIVAMASIQLGLIAYAASQAGSAARTAARTAAFGDRAGTSPGQAGRASVSSWLRDGADIAMVDTGDGVRATATIDIPSLFPGFDFDSVARRAEMPKD